MKRIKGIQLLNRFLGALVICSLLIACDDHNHEGHDHDEHDHDQMHDHVGEEHDHGTMSFTEYSAHSELFVEFSPMIAGEETDLIAHFTETGKFFKPIGQGTVVVTLDVSGHKTQNSTNSPETPGIFHLTLRPDKPGAARLTFKLVSSEWTDEFTIQGIQVYANDEAAHEAPINESSSGNISFLKEKSWMIDFATVPVVKSSFTDVIKTSGQILSAPGDEMLVTAGAVGIVLFGGSSTIPGSPVSTGTQLFSISSTGLSEGNLETEYKKLKANRDKTKVDFERASELVKAQIISEKEFQQARMDYENAQNAFNTLDKNYHNAAILVKSPMTGYLREILVSEGQFVESGTPLAVVSGNKKLLLQAIVSQKYYSQLPYIRSANFRTAERDEVFSISQFDGKLISYGKGTSSDSPFLTVTFEINNVAKKDASISPLIPGSAAEIYLQASPVSDAIVIPATSLIEEQGSFFVFVQISAEGFQKRQVKTGNSDGINVQVLSGLKEGERVVSTGAYQVKLASASRALPAHSHEH